MKIERVVIQLDRPRTVIFNMNAFYKLEKIYGSITKAFQALTHDPIKSLYYFIQCGIKGNLPIDDIELMINLENRETITQKILYAVSLALPNSDRKEEPTVKDEKWDWAWLYYAGTVLLNMDERAFWACTPNKLFSLLEVHKKYHCLDGQESKSTQPPPGYIDQFI